MCQALMVARVFTWEFERYAGDTDMPKDAKVHLTLAINQDILSHLDMYVTIIGGGEMAHLKTI